MDDTEVKLWKRYQSKRNTTNRNALIVHYFPLLHPHIVFMLRKLNSAVQYGDVLSAASLGLIKAVEAYDSTKTRFRSYLAIRVRGEVLDWARFVDHQQKNIRRFEKSKSREIEKLNGHFSECEIAHAMGLSPSRYLKLSKVSRLGELFYMDGSPTDDLGWEDEGVPSPDDKVDLESLEDKIGSILDEREKITFFSSYMDGISLRRIGEMLGCSESLSCQMRKSAMNKVRKKFSYTDLTESRQ